MVETDFYPEYREAKAMPKSLLLIDDVQLTLQRWADSSEPKFIIPDYPPFWLAIRNRFEDFFRSVGFTSVNTLEVSMLTDF